MREAKVDIIDQTEFVSLYTITFEKDELSEFEKFMQKFRDNATLQRDYQMILLALEKSPRMVLWSVISDPKGR